MNTNDALGHRQGTILMREAAGPVFAVPVPPTTDVTPARLADAMLVAPLTWSASLAWLEPDGETSTLSLLRRTVVRAELRVPGDVANAAVGRLAWLAGLDPLAEMGSVEGAGNVGRATVRVGTDVAELLITVGACAQGLRAEVRPLSINDRPADLRPLGQLQRCTRCGALQAAASSACELDGGSLVEVEDSPRPGGTIGAYRVIERLGEGGGGTVFAGEHALLGRPVAIKLLHRNLAQNPMLACRFLSEARAASRLRHPNVVDVTDFGMLGDGHPYMVMERLVGEALDDRLTRGGALPPAAALRVAREVALALGAAHDAGIAHNDLKPSNVMLLEGSSNEAPRVKLIDFGAAAQVGTAEELLFGTPGYMAPERLLGEPSDGRADLYVLGLLLYEMLSGHPPFEGDSNGSLLLAHLRDPLPPLESPFGVLPQAVQQLVTRAVAKKASERQRTAREVAAEIERALAVLDRGASRRWLP